MSRNYIYAIGVNCLKWSGYSVISVTLLHRRVICLLHLIRETCQEQRTHLQVSSWGYGQGWIFGLKGKTWRKPT